MGDPGRFGERRNNPLLQSAPARRGTRRRTEASAIADAAEQGPASSLLLGSVHSVGRVGEPGWPPIANDDHQPSHAILRAKLLNQTTQHWDTGTVPRA